MKIGFTCGAFDLLHAGHILMFKEAKEVCDYLIVGIHINPQLEKPKKNKPIESVVERAIKIKACKYVDGIVFYETLNDLENLFSILKIDIRIIGEDHKDTWTSAKEICKRKGIEIYYNKREHDFSSSELRKRIKNVKS